MEARLLATLNRILAALPSAGPGLPKLLECCGAELEALYPRLHVSFATWVPEPGRLVVDTVPSDPTNPVTPGLVLFDADVTVAGSPVNRLRAREALLLDLNIGGGPVAAALARSGYVTAFIVPLVDDGGLLGTWNLAARAGTTFGKQEREVLRHVGDALVLAIRRTQVEAQMATQTEQLLQASKLAAVGRLVAGVAHELGGPLQAIISLAEVLGRDPAREDRLEAASRILRSALRCRSMVQDLLTYARKQPHRLISVAPTGALMDAMELDRHSDVGDVQIQIVGDQHASPILADPQRLTQIFLNLITNARHASTQDGRPGNIRIIISEVPPGAARLPETEGTPIVRIAVEDDGPGVPEDLWDRIFEPFVTTKPFGGGTGLGLSISRSMALDMGGILYLDEGYGPGARFVVEFPASTDGGSDTNSTAGPPQGARILLVDDDREILETYEVILGLDHHHVHAVDRARKALDILTGGDRFDAILCDIRLPDISGPAFLEALERIDPAQARRVIFATGDVVNDQTRAFLARIPNLALIKPFQVEDLQRALAAVIGTKGR